MILGWLSDVKFQIRSNAATHLSGTYFGASQGLLRAFESFGNTMASVANARREYVEGFRKAVQPLVARMPRWHETIAGARTATFRFIQTARRFSKRLEAQQRAIEKEEQMQRRHRGHDRTL